MGAGGTGPSDSSRSVERREPDEIEKSRATATEQGSSELGALVPVLGEIRDALRAGNERETSREQQKRNRQFAFLSELRQALEPLVAAFHAESEDGRGAREGLSAAAKKVGELASSRHLKLRGSIGFEDNAASHVPDSWARTLIKQVSLLQGFVKAAELFEKRRSTLDTIVAGKDQTIDRQDLLDALRIDVEGFARAVEMVREGMEEFPSLCTKLLARVKSHHSRLQRMYNVDQEQGETAPRHPLLDLFGLDDDAPVLAKDQVPLYKGNVHLTALLSGLYARIPEKPEEAKKQSAEKDDKQGSINDGEIDPAALASFRQDLLAFADPALLEMVRTGQGYMRMARVLEGLHKSYAAFDVALKEGKLDEVQQRDPEHRHSFYAEMIETALDAAHGLGGPSSDFKDFEIGPVFNAIFNFKPAPKNADATPDAPGRAESDKDRAILRIFDNLEQMLSRLSDKSSKPIGEGELDAFIAELIELKEKVKQPEDRRRSARLARDRMAGNFHYVVEQKDHGHLVLRRAPTPNVTYEDVIGKSWEIVRARMGPLLRHTELGYLYSQGSARGRANYNMLIVGPYGCGKNHQMRALFSDPAAITIANTSDRIFTYWQYQTEKNLRSLFESAAAKREEHDRGVIIAWDEFHSIFPRKGRAGFADGSGGSGDRQQAILQSVLDGDTTYDGVGLVAYTNHFSRIPPEIYRRFSDVVLIEGLIAPERELLMKRLLSSLPLAADFDQRVNWQEFGIGSEDASADMLGKIYDRVFRLFISKYERQSRDVLKQTADEFRRLALSGERIENEQRARIYRERAPQCEITASEFMEVSTALLNEPVNQELMRAQRKFFETTRKEMRRAFGNKEKDTEP